jgi:hypothetical protein
MMTAQELDAVKERLAKATGQVVSISPQHYNRETGVSSALTFFGNAARDIAALLAEVDAVRLENAKLREALKPFAEAGDYTDLTYADLRRAAEAAGREGE